MKRKLIAFLCILTTCMLLVTPVMAKNTNESVVLYKQGSSSNNIVHSGVSGDIKWLIRENGEFVLEGNGNLEEENYGAFVFDKYGNEFFLPSNHMPWKEYSDEIVHAKIRVKNIKSLAGILSNCCNLETVDFTGSDTSKTIDFAGMLSTNYSWDGITNKLKHVDMSMLDTSSAIRMTQLLYGCVNLETVDVSGWDTSDVTDMGSVFDGCESLKTIRGIDRWDTSNVTNMFAIFQMCKSLKQLDLSGWNTGKLVNVRGAFCDCESLEELDVSTWDVSNIKDFSNMFRANCCLKELDLTNWNMESALYIDYMFSWCYELTGGIIFRSNISNYDLAFYAVAINSEKPFVIEYANDCSKELANKIYDTKGYEANLVLIESRNPFTDVPSNQYYFEPVIWAVENGITNGTSAAKFEPDKTCTRAQIVTFLWRSMGSPEPASTKNPFTDVNVNEYYGKAVLWAVEKGITTGTSRDKFSPDAECTRDQVVTFLWRAMEKPEPESTENSFKDVDVNQYYGKAVLWAVEKGITTGTSKNTFGPAQACTRGHVVTFLYRAVK